MLEVRGREKIKDNCWGWTAGMMVMPFPEMELHTALRNHTPHVFRVVGRACSPRPCCGDQLCVDPMGTIQQQLALCETHLCNLEVKGRLQMRLAGEAGRHVQLPRKE